MRKSRSIITILTLFTLSIISNSFINYETTRSIYDYTEYVLGPKSTLELNGKTNVNAFCCSSQESFPKGEITYQLDDGNATFYFKKTDLKINIQQLDCGARAINKDLQKALQSDQHPIINIALKQASNLECSQSMECDRWVEFEAIADISLACVTKTVSIPVHIKKLRDNQFRIAGNTTIYFKDFNLQPPTALMGFIKVKESIDIRFDLDAVLL